MLDNEKKKNNTTMNKIGSSLDSQELKQPLIKKELTSEIQWSPQMSEKPKNALIIIAHPYDKSFSHSIKDAAILGLKKRNKSYEIIDLIADNFDPVYRGEDLRLYSKHTITDKLSREYIDKVVNSNELIFIYPIWWGEKPAILKGFFDKVFLGGVFYDSAKLCGVSYLKGKASWILSAKIFTICQTPKIVQKIYLCNASKNIITRGTLKALKMNGVKYRNFDRISDSTPERRNKFLKKVERICSKLVY